MQGHPYYAVIEGIDGSGKSSIMEAVRSRLVHYPGVDVVTSHHPGSTALGRHIRQLVKNPQLIDPQISIDPLSRQTLYMVDTIAFINQILKPSLENGSVVLADRSSFISAIVYGLADGLNVLDLERVFSLIKSPMADRVYILNCPAEVAYKRMEGTRDGQDHYDSKPLSFFQKLSKTYLNLLTTTPEVQVLVSRFVAFENVRYIDATLPVNSIADLIVKDISQSLFSTTF